MGLVLPQKVKIKWTGTTRKHYESKGYKYTHNLDIFEISVEDLTNGSTINVDVKCDFCNTIKSMAYKDYLKNHFKQKYCCPECLKHKVVKKDINGNKEFIEIQYRNKEWLYEEYIIKNRTAKDIAQECGIHQRSLREWISVLKIPDKERPIVNLTKENLYDLYRVQKMSTAEIGKLFGVTDGAILYWMKKFNIPSFTTSEAVNIYLYEKGGIEKARLSQSTMENRIKSSCRQRGISIEDFNGFSTTEQHMARNNTYYKEWVREVFKRDNFTCQCCGKHGGNLNAHHLYNFSEYENLRYDVENGITLCEECHLVNYPNSFHSIYGERNNTPEQVYEFIENYKKEAVG